MKKINSIQYGGKTILIGLVFLCVIPAILYAVKFFFALPIPDVVIVISLVVGAAIEIGFGCILILELRQDRIIDRYYTSNPSSPQTPQQILDEHRWYRKS